MNYDPDYVKQTMFYLEDLINEKELDEIEAELQYKRSFPDTFLGAFDMLMKQNGKEDLGWKGAEFYWPVLVTQKKIDTAVYTSDILD